LVAFVAIVFEHSGGLEGYEGNVRRPGFVFHVLLELYVRLIFREKAGGIAAASAKCLSRNIGGAGNVCDLLVRLSRPHPNARASRLWLLHTGNPRDV